MTVNIPYNAVKQKFWQKHVSVSYVTFPNSDVFMNFSDNFQFLFQIFNMLLKNIQLTGLTCLPKLLKKRKTMPYENLKSKIFASVSFSVLYRNLNAVFTRRRFTTKRIYFSNFSEIPLLYSIFHMDLFLENVFDKTLFWNVCQGRKHNTQQHYQISREQYLNQNHRIFASLFAVARECCCSLVSFIFIFEVVCVSYIDLFCIARLHL